MTTAKVAGVSRQNVTGFIQLAEVGIPLIPINPENAHPMWAGWKDRATADLAQVQAWAMRYPAMAVATGRRCDILDIEVEHLDRVRDAITAHRGPVAVSARGGYHLYVRPIGRGCPRLLLDGVHVGELKGKGGTCTAPPSVRPKGAYSWLVSPWEAPLREAVPEVLALVPPKPPKKPRPAVEDFIATDAVERLERLCRWVSDLPEGERNGGLYWAACRALDENMPEDVVMSALRRASRLPADEATATIESAVKRDD